MISPNPREAAAAVLAEKYGPSTGEWAAALLDDAGLLARVTDPAAGGDLAAVRRTIHDEVMTAIKAKAGTVLAPAVVVDAAVDAAARMAAGADDSDFTDALARAYDHGRRDAAPASETGGDLAELREWVATVGEGNPWSPTPGHMLDEIGRRLAPAPASEAATEGGDEEEVKLNGRCAACGDVLPLVLAIHHDRRESTGEDCAGSDMRPSRVLAATPREQGTAEALQRLRDRYDPDAEDLDFARAVAAAATPRAEGEAAGAAGEAFALAPLRNAVDGMSDAAARLDDSDQRPAADLLRAHASAVRLHRCAPAAREVDHDAVAFLDANEKLGEALTEVGMILGLAHPAPGATWGAREVIERAHAVVGMPPAPEPSSDGGPADLTLTSVLHDLHHFLDAMRRLAVGDTRKLSAYRVTQWQLWGWCERLGLPMPGEKRPESARTGVLANELAATILRVNGTTLLSARYGAGYAAIAHLHAAGELQTDGLPGQERP